MCREILWDLDGDALGLLWLLNISEWDFFGIWMLFQPIDSMVWDSSTNLNSSQGNDMYTL